ncbi:Hypothetical predicted protein [Cloeon dipterum]|uniref:Ubiquitin-like domain-containing protein n=1 Tax=Cloeon dipterum TaxID=197152 RepID=A0A8S1DZ79_9INSE|nr:Hypothetical predicted protein [Cloeon dipterum]
MEGDGCGCSPRESSKMMLVVHPTTGGQLEVSVCPSESVESLKKRISKRLKLSKDRICLLYRDRQLRDGTLKENLLGHGSRLTLLPNCESGLMVRAHFDFYLIFKCPYSPFDLVRHVAHRVRDTCARLCPFGTVCIFVIPLRTRQMYLLILCAWLDTFSTICQEGSFADGMDRRNGSILKVCRASVGEVFFIKGYSV